MKSRKWARSSWRSKSPALDSLLARSARSEEQLSTQFLSGRHRHATQRKSGKKSSNGAREPSPHEKALADALTVHGYDYVREYWFAKPRRWRFDFALVGPKLALEVEGGVFTRGRHVRPKGFISDCEKYNAATLLGWRVLRFVPRTGWIAIALADVKEATSRASITLLSPPETDIDHAA
jgi:very-short-patch-repair endonuclease